MRRRPPRSTLFPCSTLSGSPDRLGPRIGGPVSARSPAGPGLPTAQRSDGRGVHRLALEEPPHRPRSEEHTSELQSQSNLVCRLLLEKKQRPSDCSAASSTTY